MEPLEHTTDYIGRHLEPFDVLKLRYKKGSWLRQAEVYTPLPGYPYGIKELSDLRKLKNDYRNI